MTEEITHTPKSFGDQSLKTEADGYVTRGSGRTLLHSVHPERAPERFDTLGFNG